MKISEHCLQCKETHITVVFGSRIGEKYSSDTDQCADCISSDDRRRGSQESVNRIFGKMGGNSAA